MGRHKRMDSAAQPRENSDTAADATQGDIWRPSIEPAHQERFDTLIQYRPKILVADLAAIRTVAAAMIAQAPGQCGRARCQKFSGLEDKSAGTRFRNLRADLQS